MEGEGDCNIDRSTFDKEELGDEEFDDLDEIDASNPYGDWTTVQQEGQTVEQKASGKHKHKKKKNKKNKEKSLDNCKERSLDNFRDHIVKFEKGLISKRKQLKQMLDIDKELNQSDNPRSHPNLDLVIKLGLNVGPEERQKRISELRERVGKLLLMYEEKLVTLQVEEKAQEQELQTVQKSTEQQQHQLLQQDQHPCEQPRLPYQQDHQHSHQLYPQEKYQVPKKNLPITNMVQILQKVAGCEMTKDSDALQGVEVIILLLQFLQEYYETHQNHQVCEILQKMKSNMDIVKTIMQDAGILSQ